MSSQKQLIESEVKSFGGENIQAHSYSNYSVKSEPSASLYAQFTGVQLKRKAKLMSVIGLNIGFRLAHYIQL